MEKMVSAEKKSEKVESKSSDKRSLLKPNLEIMFIGEKDASLKANTLMEGFNSSDKTTVLVQPEGIADRAIMFGILRTPEYRLTSFEKMEIANNGISKKGLQALKTKAALDYDRLAKMLSTTKVTLFKKKGDEKYGAALSERILSIADIYSYGYEVFENVDRFNNWILQPNRALGGKAPYEVMDNQFGREEVRNIIGRIDYGVYS